MRDQELVNAIRRLKVETGSLACMGCGREHNCGVSGCAIMREAADRIANQSNHIAALQQEIEKLRGQNEQLREAAALVAKESAELLERRWIPVTEREPEEIDMDHEAAEQLRHLCRNCDLDRLEKLAEADRDGRLVVLPCKVGDMVYFTLLGRIIEKQVFSIVSFSDSTRIYCGGTSEYFRPEDIGKTFFLTREEAEKALEAKKDE